MARTYYHSHQSLLTELEKQFFQDLPLGSKFDQLQNNPIWLSGCFRSGKSSIVKYLADTNNCKVVVIEPPENEQKNKVLYRRTLLKQLQIWINQSVNPPPQVVWNIALDDEIYRLEAIETILLEIIHNQVNEPFLWLILFNDHTDRTWVNIITALYKRVRNKTNRKNPYLVMECWHTRSKVCLGQMGERIEEQDDKKAAPIKKPFDKVKNKIDGGNKVATDISFEDWKFDEDLNKTTLTISNTESLNSGKSKVSDRWVRIFLEESINAYSDGWQFFSSLVNQHNFRRAMWHWVGNHFGANELLFHIIDDKYAYITETDSIEGYSLQIQNCIDAYLAQNSDRIIHEFMEKLEKSCGGINLANPTGWEKKNLELIGLYNDDYPIKLITYYFQKIKNTTTEDIDMEQTTYALMGAMKIAEWLWSSEGVKVAADKVMEVIGKGFAEKIERMFKKTRPDFPSDNDKEREALVEAQKELEAIHNYTDKDLLEDVKRTIRQLLTSNDNYTDSDLYTLWLDFVDSSYPPEQFSTKLERSKRLGIAVDIVNHVNTRKRLPELINAMKAIT